MNSHLLTLNKETRRFFIKEEIPCSDIPYPEIFFHLLLFLNEEHKKLKSSNSKTGGFTEEIQSSRGKSVAIWTQLLGTPISITHPHILKRLGIENDLGSFVKTEGHGKIREAEDILRNYCRHADGLYKNHDLYNACYLLADIHIFLRIRKNDKNLKYDNADVEAKDYFCMYCHRLRTIKMTYCTYHQSGSSNYSTAYYRNKRAFEKLGNIDISNETKPKRLVAWAKHHPENKDLIEKIDLLKTKYDEKTWSTEHLNMIMECFYIMQPYLHTKDLITVPSIKNLPGKWSIDNMLEIINEILSTDYTSLIEPYYFLESLKRMSFFSLIDIASKSNPDNPCNITTFSLEDSGRVKS